jgi:hypothetical protein
VGLHNPAVHYDARHLILSELSGPRHGASVERNRIQAIQRLDGALLIHAEDSGNADKSYNDIVRPFYDALYRMNAEVDFVDPSTTDLSAYKLIVVLDRETEPFSAPPHSLLPEHLEIVFQLKLLNARARRSFASRTIPILFVSSPLLDKKIYASCPSMIGGWNGDADFYNFLRQAFIIMNWLEPHAMQYIYLATRRRQ